MNWEQHFRNLKPSVKRTSPRYSTEYRFGFGSDFGAADFGAMARGTAIANTNGAVIPPGRYWLDTFDDLKGTRTQFMKWLTQKPEVRVETTQEDSESNPRRLFTIFTIPANASNYGVAGVWFPTVALGFPTIAPAAGKTAVTQSDDTVQKPSAPTSTEVAKDIANSLGSILGAGTKGVVDNVSSGTMLKLGLVAGAVLLVMLLPGMLTKHAVHAAL